MVPGTGVGGSGGRSERLPKQHEAARDSDLETLKQMMTACGKDVVDAVDKNGWKPIHVAARARPVPPTRNGCCCHMPYCRLPHPPVPPLLTSPWICCVHKVWAA